MFNSKKKPEAAPPAPPHKDSAAEKELFQQFSKIADGFQMEDVAGAAVNILLNIIRQKNGTPQAAAATLDSLHGHMRAALVAQYQR